MAKTTIITPFKMAAKNYVDGEEVAKDRFYEMLEKMKADDSEIYETMEFLVESSDGDELNFDLVFGYLTEKGKDSLEMAKKIVASHSGKSAIHVANKLVAQAQKNDFFRACERSDAIALEAMIRELGAPLASKVIDERGQTGLHIICKRSAGVDLKMLKVFENAGFDKEAQDLDGVTPLMIMQGIVPKAMEVTAERVVEKTPSSSVKPSAEAVVLDDKQNSPAAAAA